MKFVKKNIKLIIGIIVSMLLISGISVYATAQYYATQVEYKDGKSVASALDELYNMRKTPFTGEFYLSGSIINDTTYAGKSYCDIDVKNYNKIKISITSYDPNYSSCKLYDENDNIIQDMTTSGSYELNINSYNKIRIKYEQTGGWRYIKGSYELSN